MKLPELLTPTYSIDLPISKTKIRFRPWLMKEQKILLMATESNDEASLLDALLQILNNCLVENVDLLKLPQIDVEYYFYQLRSKSQSEIVETKYKCNNKVGDSICGNTMSHNFNLTSDLTIINEDIPNIIELTDTVGIKFHTPYFEIADLNRDFSNLKTEDLFNEIIKHVEYIYDDKSTYRPEELSSGQLLTFLEGLTTQQFEKIDTFFDKLPKIVKNIEMSCSKCGYEHKIVVEDIFSFFI